MTIPNDLLETILRSGEVSHPEGRTFKLTSASSLAECEAMYRFLREQRPDTVVEIGMGYGVSALTILTALEENGKGSLISVDPYLKWNSAREVALHYVDCAGLAHRHRHIHEPSELALPELVKEGTRAEFVYIDGHHGFDHAFVDFFYADLLVDVGGVLVFDDSYWPAVHKAIDYMTQHREYEELDVGVARLNSVRALSKWVLQRRRGPSRYFRKTGPWVAPYHFHKRF